jgi:hypothetical protein
MAKTPKNPRGWFFERFSLKLILNLWTAVAIVLFSADFFSGNKYDSAASVIGVIYLALLGIYAGEKEYIRWQTRFASKFSGELFVAVWTVLMLVFAVCAPFSGGAFRLPADFAVVYTSIIGVFAITQHSKNLHNQRQS